MLEEGRADREEGVRGVIALLRLWEGREGGGGRGALGLEEEWGGWVGRVMGREAPEAEVKGFGEGWRLLMRRAAVQGNGYVLGKAGLFGGWREGMGEAEEAEATDALLREAAGLSEAAVTLLRLKVRAGGLSGGEDRRSLEVS